MRGGWGGVQEQRPWRTHRNIFFFLFLEVEAKKMKECCLVCTWLYRDLQCRCTIAVRKCLDLNSVAIVTIMWQAVFWIFANVPVSGLCALYTLSRSPASTYVTSHFADGLMSTEWLCDRTYLPRPKSCRFWKVTMLISSDFVVSLAATSCILIIAELRRLLVTPLH